MWEDTSGAAERRPAGRTLLVVLGWVLCLAGLAIGCKAIYDLTQIGTCASGGPYVSARPCPEGTGLKIMSVFGAAVLGLLGLACHAIGSRGQRTASRIGFGLIMWSLLFLSIAGTVAYAAFGPDAQPDNEGARIAAIVMLVTFVPMALIPLLGIGALGFASRRGRDEGDGDAIPLDPRAVALAPRPSARPAATTPVVPLVTTVQPPAAPGAGESSDPVDQLERLAHLKATGAIDAAEYERLKDRIIGA